MRKKENIFTPSFSLHNRLLIVFASIIILLIICIAINYKHFRTAANVDAVDNLSGQRIGTVVGWETDILLTGRDDLTLVRYDDNATAITALGFNQIDAVGMDESTANYTLNLTSGLEQLPDPIAHIGMTMLVPPDQDELCQEISDYSAKFKTEDFYENFRSRALFENGETTFDFVDVGDAKNPTRTLRVGYVEENVQEGSYNNQTGRMEGYGVEFLERFAKDKGYALDWVQCSDDSIEIMIQMGDLDIGLYLTTDVYRDAYEGEALLPDAYIEEDVYLLTLPDGNKLKMKGVIDM